MTSRINLGEVGGSGLRLLSSLAEPAVADPTGSFETVVSADAAQMLIVTDSSGRARALATSLPGKAIQVDALSTTLTLVFLVRGILSTDSAEAEARLAQIQSMNSFSALLAFVRRQLPLNSLDVIASDPAYSPLLKAVITQWQSLTAVNARAIASVEPSLATGNIGLSYANEDPTTSSALTISNSAWRYVSLVHQDLGENSELLGDPVLPIIQGVANPSSQRNIMPSANGISWGDIFSSIASGQNQVYAPSAGSEQLALAGRPEVKRIGYYIYGPGRVGSGIPRFADNVERLLENSQAFALTTIYFGLVPMLDFVAPFLKSATKLADLHRSVVDSLAADAGNVVNGAGLETAYQSGGTTNIVTAWTNFLTPLLGLGAAGLATFFAGTPLAAGAAVVGAVLGFSAVVFSADQFLLAVASTLNNPMRQVVEIEAPSERSIGRLAHVINHELGASNSLILHQLTPDGTAIYSTLVNVTNGQSREVRWVTSDGEITTLFQSSDNTEVTLSSDRVLAVTANPPEYFNVVTPLFRFSLAIPEDLLGEEPVTRQFYQIAGIVETNENKWVVMNVQITQAATRRHVLWIVNTENRLGQLVDLGPLGLANLQPDDNSLFYFQFTTGREGWTRGTHVIRSSGFSPQVDTNFRFRIDPQSVTPLRDIVTIWIAEDGGTNPATGGKFAGQYAFPEAFSVNRFGSYASALYSVGETSFSLADAPWDVRIRQNLSGTAQALPSEASQQTFGTLAGPNLYGRVQLVLNDNGGMLLRKFNGNSDGVYFFRPRSGGEVEVNDILVRLPDSNFPETYMGAGPFFAVLSASQSTTLRLFQELEN